MHAQIKASPDDTAENVQRILNALAGADINILAIAPDFDPPHVRVLVSHDDMNAAMSALSDAGLTPQEKSALLLTIPNVPAALKKAMDGIAKRKLKVESVLVLPEPDQPGTAKVSFGVAKTAISGWDDEFETIQAEIEQEIA
jgi:hypothetical protein